MNSRFVKKKKKWGECGCFFLLYHNNFPDIPSNFSLGIQTSLFCCQLCYFEISCINRLKISTFQKLKGSYTRNCFPAPCYSSSTLSCKPQGVPREAAVALLFGMLIDTCIKKRTWRSIVTSHSICLP